MLDRLGATGEGEGLEEGLPHGPERRCYRAAAAARLHTPMLQRAHELRDVSRIGAFVHAHSHSADHDLDRATRLGSAGMATGTNCGDCSAFSLSCFDRYDSRVSLMWGADANFAAL